MRITALSRTILQPFGPLNPPVPGKVSRSFVSPDSGTLILPSVGGAWAVGLDPDAGTLLATGGAIAADDGTLILAGGGAIGLDPDAGTLLTP